MKKVVIIISCIVFFGCTTVSILKPTENEIVSRRKEMPGLNLEEVQKGFKIYKFNCSGCHYLHKPTDYTIEGWEKILPEMIGRAKINSENDQRLIKKYLFLKSRK